MTEVLVVDDDLWQLRQHRRVLMKAGIHARVARTIHDAMSMIDQRSPDVLLVDVLLSGNSIVTLLNELQSHNDLSRIPCIVCSNVAEYLPNRLSEYGIYRIIDKSTMHPNDIVAAVRSVM